MTAVSFMKSTRIYFRTSDLQIYSGIQNLTIESGTAEI
jgi:hypothetical protein